MMFLIDRSGGQPLHVKLYTEIKNQIYSGKLAPNTRLPSIRHLSADLSISRNTVEYAYEQLRMEGFIHSKPQSGYYVSLLEQEFKTCPSPITVKPIGQALGTEKAYLFDFHPAFVSTDSFPSKLWCKLLTECIQESVEHQNSPYGIPQGDYELRCEIQRYLERFRGVSCVPEQIIICCGLQDSLSIAAQLLRAEHSVLAVENPGHWIPTSVFQGWSFSINPITVNSDGIGLDDLKNSNSTVVYVTPSHQFPLGCVMPVENRLKLINWAENVGGVIIEDDYDSELRYHGKPIPALQGLYPNGNIIYLGTFSKVLSPALRVSYMVLPFHFLQVYNKLLGRYASTVSLLEQKTLSKFMKQGYWERHLRKMRTIYRKKHDVMLKSIEHYFSGRINIRGQGAGLHVVLELVGSSLDERGLILRASEKNVRLYPLSDTYQSAYHHSTSVMLGFGRMSPDELDEGIRLLSDAWDL